MKKRLIALALALCVFACAGLCAPVARAAGSKVYVVSNTLRAYKSASTSSKSLGVLSYGESLTCVSSSGGWAKVKNGSGATGYCQIGGLSTSNPNTLNVSASVNTANAPLYKRPDAGTAVWMRLKKGAKFTAVAMTKDNAWVCLKNGKYYGYMQAKYLTTAATGSTAAPTPAPQSGLSGRVYVVVNSLGVYAKASTSAKSKGGVYYGQSLTCVSVSGDWAKVKSDSGATGFCKIDGLSTENPNTLSRKVYVNTANAPVYKRPVAGSAVWTRLKKNASFTAVAVTPDGAWTRIQNGKYFGYIPTQYLSSSEATVAPDAPAATPAPTAVYVAGNTLKIYSSASASAKLLSTLGYGEGLTLTGTAGEWAQVRLASGATGFCAAGDLTTKNPNTYARTVYINAANAPVYKLPLSGSAVWTKLKKNASFTAVAITPDGEWFRLQNGKYYAYIQSKYVSSMKDEGNQTVYVTALSLPVYADAATSAKSLGNMYLGQSVTLIGSADGWAKVRNGSGTTGYCQTGGLSAKNPNTLNRACYAKSKGVKVYAKPSTESTVARTVDLNASLMLVCVSADGAWGRAALDGGEFGYVQMSDLSATKIDDGTLIADISPVTAYVVPTTLTVYAEPSKASKSVGTMCFGQSLRCTGKSSTWARVTNDAGAVGYCEIQSLTTKNPNAYSTALYAQAEGAKVYQKPQASSTVLATLSLNAKVTGVCYNEDRSWYRVQNGSTYGYVQAAFFATTQMKDQGQSGTIGKIVSLAKTYLGVPYVYGGQSPKGFDCSGFVYYVYKNAAGVTLKRTAYTQGYDDKYPKITNKVDLKVGDVLFFNTVSDDDACDHAGIYLGNNQFIHASSGGGKVMISSLGTNSSSYYFRTYSWARRILS